jgi:LAO/AO transport system kinase
MKHAAAEGHPASAALRRLSAIRRGDRAAIARAITAIENGLPDARALVAALASDLGRAHVVGVTGAPGAGKSTLINALLQDYTSRGLRVAVVAIDPSSPITGGAVLGDRIRMADGGAADSVFIRSLASRGHLGGLARTARDIVDLLDAAGFDTIVVETVGAGQSEVDVRLLADTSVVVCPPGLGDDVQAIKAGILEIADVLVVSKGDSPLAGRTVRELTEMLALRRKHDGWKVPVQLTTAIGGKGIAELVDVAIAHATAAGRGRRLRVDGRNRDGAASPHGEAFAHVQELADRDAYFRHCGARLADAAAGTATVEMTVGAQHLNFNGTCHGGAIFSLADCAFGLASNSHGPVAAGIDAHVTYHVAAREGETLTARAQEVHRGPRTAVYRIDVARADGTTIASFTGTVYVTSRSHARRETPAS